MLDLKCLDPEPDLLGTLQGLLRLHVRHQQQEFLTTIAKSIGFPHRVFQKLTDRSKNGITGVVTKFIVEALEMVDVEHDAADRSIGSARLHQLGFEYRLKPPPVGKSG
jgi:hypothetical protein